MKRLLISVISLGFLALAGCVVVPARGYYYHPAAVVMAPAPIIAVRP